MFKKLKVKFIATTMSLLTCIVIIIIAFIYIGMKNSSEYEIFSRINEILTSSAGRFNDSGLPWEDRTGIIICNYNKESTNLKYSTSMNIEKQDVKKIAYTALSGKDKGFIESGDYNFAYVYNNSPGGVSIVFKEISIYKNTMRSFIITSLIIGLASIGVLFLFSVFIAKKAIEPVEEAYNSQKEFIANASHELKTPLAIISTNIDLLNSNGEDKINNQRKWLDYIQFQTNRMSKLVGNLLYLAKADNNEILGTEAEFNLSDCIMNQVLTFEAVLYENKLELNCDIEDGIKFSGDKEGINQVIGILLDNAVKYSFKNSEIKVSLKSTKQKVYLSVSNNGESIPSEDLDKIFDRFYRVDKSRSREKGGYGLGLSIAKTIIERYKGKIYAKSDNNTTTFFVEFPLNKIQ